jgi:hypothetical protein
MIVNYTDKLRYHLSGNISRLDVRLFGHVEYADVRYATEVAFRSERERDPLIPRSVPYRFQTWHTNTLNLNGGILPELTELLHQMEIAVGIEDYLSIRFDRNRVCRA